MDEVIKEAQKVVWKVDEQVVDENTKRRRPLLLFGHIGHERMFLPPKETPTVIVIDEQEKPLADRKIQDGSLIKVIDHDYYPTVREAQKPWYSRFSKNHKKRR